MKLLAIDYIIFRISSRDGGPISLTIIAFCYIIICLRLSAFRDVEFSSEILCSVIIDYAFLQTWAETWPWVWGGQKIVTLK